MKTPISETMEVVHKHPGTSGFKSMVVTYWSPINGSIMIVEETEDGEFIGSFKPNTRCKQQKQLVACIGKLMNFLSIDELSEFTEQLNNLTEERSTTENK